MMNITNVFAKFLFLLVFIILGSTWTDCLNINMINKRLTPPQTKPMNAFKNQKRISASERTLIPRKTPEKME